MVWLNAAAVSLSIIAVLGLLLLLAMRGLGHFWPAAVLAAEVQYQGSSRSVLGEVADRVEVSAEQLEAAGYELTGPGPFFQRSLVKQGNRDFLGSDFVLVLDEQIVQQRYPRGVMVLERMEWGNFYGYPLALLRNGDLVARFNEDGDHARQALQEVLTASAQTRDEIRRIERGEIGGINYRLERLRLRERGLQLRVAATPEALAGLALERREMQQQYAVLQTQLSTLYARLDAYTLQAALADGRTVSLPLSKVLRAYMPNDLNAWGRLSLYITRLWEFLSDDPREANTEGGVFPAIFGTVMMVILMSVIVTPFGVVAAVYLREYARQGLLTRIIRVAVNNLAGVPSIVYGVFGLGFFIYFLGGELDQLFFPEALPSPTFGTPGLMWASLTLALLTLPVVIVATEEGLSRIPKSVREGSLALGATRAETLWRIVLPMASPAMMTGLILAVARAAGEVAPLMLVGVVKLAPSLPVTTNYPYVHLDQKFMHLGFHIYDVGFQSPNVEAARPLVYATALLLVTIIVLLNLVAVTLRNRLREKYKALES
jgi:phosphate transport system permease protein